MSENEAAHPTGEPPPLGLIEKSAERDVSMMVEYGLLRLRYMTEVSQSFIGEVSAVLASTEQLASGIQYESMLDAAVEANVSRGLERDEVGEGAEERLQVREEAWGELGVRLHD